MRENFVQPLAIGFQANQEMQGRKTKRNPTWTISQGIAKSSHAMWNSKGQKLQDKFRALSGVHYIHTIYFFEAWEVKSLTFQMMCKSELKWRSSGHWKTTALSWSRVISKWFWNPTYEFEIQFVNSKFTSKWHQFRMHPLPLWCFASSTSGIAYRALH